MSPKDSATLPTPPPEDSDLEPLLHAHHQPPLERSFPSRPRPIPLLGRDSNFSGFRATLSPSPPSHPSSPVTPVAPAPPTHQAPPAARRWFRSEWHWLLLYFGFNLGLTLYNKLVLVRFPFPYTLTALHTFSGTIGSYVAMECGYFVPAMLSFHEVALLTAFSFLYTINIAVSNLSLQLVTVPFHQVVRAATPLFVIVLSYFLLGRALSRPKIISLVPVVAGVGFATYGDYYFTLAGLLLTLLGAVLAALKTIATNMFQTGRTARTRALPAIFFPSHPIKLHPLDILLRMSPLAFVQCVVYAHLSGELDGVRLYAAEHITPRRVLELAVNSIMAFGLNVVSFTTNSKVGPLSITVAANVKQVLTILLSVSLFHLVITPANMVGIALTLGGGAWYAAIEYREREGRRKTRLPVISPTMPESYWVSR